MKKITLFAAAVLAVSFTSCKKDHTCTCTEVSTTTKVTTTPIGSNTVTDTDTYTGDITYTKARKGDAKAKCISYKENFTTTEKSGSTTVTTTYDNKGDCSLK